MSSSFTNMMRRFLGPKDREAATEQSAEAVEYEGYRIQPASRKQGSQWLTAGTISKTFANEAADEVKEHHFIRADMHASKDDADACAILKGKRIVDEQGDKMFG